MITLAVISITVVAVSVITALTIVRLVGHKHVWRIVDRKEESSTLDVMRAAGVTNFKGNGLTDSWEALTRRRLLVTRKCDTCGTQEVRRV